MRRTVTRLADGRELIYYDEPGAPERTAVDRRDLPSIRPASGGELRHDAIRDEWVVIAAHRADRTHLPPSEQCPLCPSTALRLTEVPDSDYDVVVFENRFPSLTPPVGRCEVICFTADHKASFASLSPIRARTVIDALADRTAELSTLPGVEQVFCFENRGEEIGVTLSHPHGQIYAYSFLTPDTRQMLAAARAYQPGSLFGERLAAERAAGVRMVSANEHWSAFVPAAARWPFEVHLYPHRAVPDLPALSDPERDAFTQVYLDVLGRLDALFDRPMPYVAAWHQAPVRQDRHLAWLHLELLGARRGPDKLKYLAGSESAMGVFINDIRPEDAARRLREARP